MPLTKDVVLTETQYGGVLLDAVGGGYWELNPTGYLIVRTLAEGGSHADAAAAVATEYAVDEAGARADVEALISQLRDARLITD